ncbi:MAG: hypothetical protein ACREF3_06640 [Acetobacteraceae bacterium]
MEHREAAFVNLAVGDIFHAESPNGASLLCLVTSLTDASIQARTVTTQICLQFDRRTGIAEWGNHSVPCTIDSIAPLPADIRDIVLGIDVKFRSEQKTERLRLSDAEKRALIYVDSHYSSNQL